MVKLKEFKSSIWKVPLISLIAGLLYNHIYSYFVIKYGVIEPGVLDNRVCLIVSGCIMIATLLIGGFLLRKNIRKEIFVSSTVVVIYGLILTLLQHITGSTTGPVAVWFINLFMPLNWTGFVTELAVYLQNKGINIILLYYLKFFIPWLFILFGKKESK